MPETNNMFQFLHIQSTFMQRNSSAVGHDVDINDGSTGHFCLQPLIVEEDIEVSPCWPATENAIVVLLCFILIR